MGIWIFRTLFISLVMTIILEEIFAVIIGVRGKRDLLLLCMVNVLTNPVAVLIYYLLYYYTSLNLVIVTTVLELIVIFVEAGYFKIYGKNIRNPYLYAICINMFSFCTGKIINIFI